MTEQSTSAKAQTDLLQKISDYGRALAQCAAAGGGHFYQKHLAEAERAKAEITQSLDSQEAELSTLRARVAGLTKQLKSEIEMASAGMRIHLALKSQHAALKAELEAKAQGVASVIDAERLLRNEASRLERIYCTRGSWFGFEAEKKSHEEHLRVAADLAAAPSPAVPAPAVEIAVGPCGQCKDSRQPCACQIATMLKERGLVAVDSNHYAKVSARAKAATPAEVVPAPDSVTLESADVRGLHAMLQSMGPDFPGLHIKYLSADKAPDAAHGWYFSEVDAEEEGVVGPLHTVEAVPATDARDAAVATEYTVGEMRVVLTKSIGSTQKWAVRDGYKVLGRNGEWLWEPAFEAWHTENHKQSLEHYGDTYHNVHVRDRWRGWQAASAQAVQAVVPDAHRYNFTDGHRTLEQDVSNAIHDYAATKPEQDPDDPESWESWFEAAFDLLGDRVGLIFEEHAARTAAAHQAALAAAPQPGAQATPVDAKQAVQMPDPFAIVRFRRSQAGHENDMPDVLSCNWMPDGAYKVYTEQQVRAMLAAPAAVASHLTFDDLADLTALMKSEGGEIVAKAPAAPVLQPLWVNPNDKAQKQYLPHIGEPVLFKHEGRVYTGKHTGGSFKADYPMGKTFDTWLCLWAYPSVLDN